MRSILAQLNVQLGVAIVAVLFSVAAYWLTRRRELAWKRTEFLFEQSRYFDNDSELIELVTILEDRHASVTINQIFGSDSKLGEDAQKAWLQRFDKLFNFLWRLCYAYLETKTLSLKEIEAFGWYFYRISDSPLLVEYCGNYGFDEINTVIKQLKVIWEEDE